MKDYLHLLYTPRVGVKSHQSRYPAKFGRTRYEAGILNRRESANVSSWLNILSALDEHMSQIEAVFQSRVRARMGMYLCMASVQEENGTFNKRISFTKKMFPTKHK